MCIITWRKKRKKRPGAFCPRSCGLNIHFQNGIGKKCGYFRKSNGDERRGKGDVSILWRREIAVNQEDWLLSNNLTCLHKCDRSIPLSHLYYKKIDPPWKMGLSFSMLVTKTIRKIGKIFAAYSLYIRTVCSSYLNSWIILQTRIRSARITRTTRSTRVIVWGY